MTSTPTIEIPPRAWTRRQTRHFAARLDLRDLLVIDHPWLPSRRGGSGEWTVRCRLPADWPAGAPVFLSFYQCDNYSGSCQASEWTGTQAYLGHRFKQLLVNGRVLWESDVADEEFAGTVKDNFAAAPGRAAYREPYRLIEIPRGVGRDLALTFRVLDKVPSTTKLAGDAYRRFSWSACDPTEARRNFQTTVWFGDVFLTRQRAIVRPAEKPSAGRTAPPPRSPPIPRRGIALALTGDGRLPTPGYPVRTGVPLPAGRFRAGTSFALREPRGQPVPLVTRELSHWPDRSVRWLLCEFVATTRGTYRLLPGRRAKLPDPVRVRTGRGGLTVANGVLTLRIGPARGTGVFAGVTCPNGLDLGAMDLSVKLNRVGWRDHFTARRRRVTVETANPLCVVLRLEGDLVDKNQRRFGPWRARLQVWHGLPYLLADWRLVNESDQAMAVLLDWSARIALPQLDEAVADFGAFAPGYDLDDISLIAIGHRGDIPDARAIPLHQDSELSCRQERPDQARLYRNTSWVATTKQAAGFVNLRHARGGVVGAMRWFAEEFPKGIVVRPDRLTLATLPESEDALAWPHDRPSVRLGRGEAKRQVFALWLHDGAVPAAEAERFSASVHDAPQLFDQSWFIGSGALEAGPPRDTPALARWARTMTPLIERTGIKVARLGHREYWDTAWSNDYRGRAHLGLIQYVETGDPRWRRYFEASCTHNRDVDIIHFCPEHPDWVGATHAYGEDHTAAGPMGSIGLNCDSLLDHYLLTGDPESWDAARGLAEHVLTCNPWDRCARCVGWPLAQLVRWYDQTHDRRVGKKIAEFMTAAHAYIEPRRGVFDETHGCYNYRGPVAFMDGYLAFGLIRHHQLTGDPGTLGLLHKFAAGLFAEARVAPGRFRYSPFPENNLSGGGVWRTRSWNGLVGGLAGYLSLATGEPRYAAWAQECYRGIVGKSPDPQASMDMLPIAGWMLQAVAAKRSWRRTAPGRGLIPSESE